MQSPIENRIIAVAVLIVALITLFSTVSPSVSFWDPAERIAAAYLVQIPHPPGAPMFILMGRVLAMIPFAEDIAFRVNTISVLSGAFAVMLLYLIIARLIVYFRGKPESIGDKIVVYGSGVIGSLSLLWSHTFWFNATEAETYAASLFLAALVVWLGFIWYEKADQKGSERYLLLGAYIIGLSIGVHLLSAMAIFPVALIIYFRRYKPEWGSFIKYGLATAGVFFIVYPGIVKWIPSMLDGHLTIGGFIDIQESGFLKLLPPLMLAAALYTLYVSVQNKQKYLNIAMLSLILISFGFTTYASVLIRSNANPPMNQNQPDTMNRLVSYLNREQYGDTPLFDRRWNPEPAFQQNYMRYSSDFDYMLRYQIGHMYVRYLGHNFIGKESDDQDAGVDWKGYFALPFILGLLGAWYHFRRDWKWGMVLLAFFVVTGVALAFVFNMAEPQPRERDYFFAGSFFVFAAWIGIGASALLDALRDVLRNRGLQTGGLAAGAAVLFIASPINLATTNWNERDRTGHYIAWDYAYNLLQNVEQDAILFTNGDNDTFPLWYLQDVEGIRTDVRVVNLSLLNTPWYVRQLKNQRPHGAKPVPISLTEGQIDQLRPSRFEAREFELPVPDHVYDDFGIDNPDVRAQGRIRWTMRPSTRMNGVGIIRTQDFMVRDIVMTTRWERPVYFAVTVPDNGSKIGLDDYLRLDGLVQLITPIRDEHRRTIGVEAVRQSIFNEPDTFSREPRYGYTFRGLNDPSVHLEEQSRRLTINYRNAFFQLAMYYQHTRRDHDMTVRVLDRMEEVLPRNRVELPAGMTYELGKLYLNAGRRDVFDEIASEVIERMEKQIQRDPRPPLTGNNPYVILMNIYDDMNDFERERDILVRLQLHYPDVAEVASFTQQRIRQLSLLIDDDDAETESVPPDTLQIDGGDPLE
jgi:hypothetical protein